MAKRYTRDGYDYGPTDRVASRAMAGDNPSGEGTLDRSGGGRQGSLGAALDPRQRIFRDPFNELVVFVVSAVGASLVVPVFLLLVGAFTGEYPFLLFVGLSVVLELLLIGSLRPAMKPHEQAGWMLLWGFTAAVLGAAFWELVFAPVLS
ncbi:MAG: hypothetical protein M3499_05605 [Actinomycetota bacterium]|nr:hypothetical protein [Actinomycetota bacterium]